MSVLLTPECLLALFTVVAGVTVYGLAPCLPSALPHAFTRLVGLGTTGIALVPLFVFSDSLAVTVAAGCLGLLVIIGIHVWQTRRGKSV